MTRHQFTAAVLTTIIVLFIAGVFTLFGAAVSNSWPTAVAGLCLIAPGAVALVVTSVYGIYSWVLEGF